MNQKIRDLLYRSLDGNLSDNERRMLDDALAASAALRSELADATRLRGALAADPDWKFEPFFVQRVMQRISQPDMLNNVTEILTAALVRLFRPVAAVTVAVLLLLAGWNVVATGKVAPANEQASAADHMLETPVDLLLEENQ